MEEYRTSDAKRRLAQIILAAGEFGQPMVATPGLPSDRIKSLRDAYAKSMKDPELLAEAKKSKMDVDATSGEELYEIIREVMESSPAVVEEVKKLLEN